MQKRRNSIANALELRFSYINSSTIYMVIVQKDVMFINL